MKNQSYSVSEEFLAETWYELMEDLLAKIQTAFRHAQESDLTR